MQKPTSEEGALIKREWWKTWEKDDFQTVITSFKVTILRF